MRRFTFISFAFFCLSFLCKAQHKNEDLYQAIIKQDSGKVTAVLKEGADVNYIKQSGPWMKVSMLIIAVNSNNVGLAQLMLKHKADVNWKDGFKTSALMYAAAKGNKAMVALLLDHGADINASDGQGNTVLSAAKESKDMELVAFIAERLKEKQ